MVTAFQIEDERYWPAIYGLPSPVNTNAREPRQANGAKVLWCFDSRYNCDWIYGNRSKLHIGSYEIINFKDFKAL